MRFKLLFANKYLFLSIILVTTFVIPQEKGAMDMEKGILGWSPAEAPLLTPWAKDVNPLNPHPEYPRPQMVRDSWINLNGLWDYVITEREFPPPEEFEGKILVPFPIESALSGVKKELKSDQFLWYRRTFKAPSLMGGRRLLLHFGAVDWEATVFLNGEEIGSHRGGYDSFTFDISDKVKPGEENELMVRVWDPTEDGVQARGKQFRRAISEPAGIWYTPCSGIWQTVWLEVVPATYIENLRIIPELDSNSVKVKVSVKGEAKDATLEIGVLSEGKEVAKGTGKPDEIIVIPIKDPILWTPDNPFLYSLKIELLSGGRKIDNVESYFGMRKVSIGKDENGTIRILLNNKFIFQAGPLDQGFWPDGIYTAPTDEALRFDIEMMKKLGFNAVRKHVKREPDRWYYWCDKLGLLVWQDMPSGTVGRGATQERDGEPISRESAEQFEKELRNMVEQLYNHPSIIMWIVFNESWGQYDTARLVEMVRESDKTRLVSGASGWFVYPEIGDVIDIHSYPSPSSPKPDGKRALVVGEFGGLGYIVEGHTWLKQGWGYRSLPNERALTIAFLKLWKGVWELKEEMGLCGAIYTQLTDVETECNGLLTYDRKVVKMPIEKIAPAISRGEIKLPVYKVVVPTAQNEKIIWRYTTSEPPSDWFKPEFDDSSWQEGIGGFGVPGTPGAIVGTEWRTSDIWLRRKFYLPSLSDNELKSLRLRIHHDEDAEVYVNGVLALSVRGFTTEYEEEEISKEALPALKIGGENLLAIHCHQTEGGQFIDAGFVLEIEEASR
ncbi:glycoside hydrolase family 2 [bacterium]|nr:glycoside hydrolase family 2 [bacterium]